MAEIRIGVSGWRYKPWRGIFYPQDLPQRLELEYLSSAFPAVELNGSFYSLQYPTAYAKWYEATPQDFVFAVKGSRYITHMLKLRDVKTPLANFFASGLLGLQQKLGPILWQFPASFRYEHDRMQRFFDLLPQDTASAVKLARRHDERLRGRARLTIDRNRPLRHAVEVRSESFLEAGFVNLLRDYNIALVVADTAKRWPLVYDVTADFVYVRLHGDKEIYSSGYSDKALAGWARRIAAWHRGAEPRETAKISAQKPRPRKSRDIYCFFDNDIKVRAPFDARSLMRKLKLNTDPPTA